MATGDDALLAAMVTILSGDPVIATNCPGGIYPQSLIPPEPVDGDTADDYPYVTPDAFSDADNPLQPVRAIAMVRHPRQQSPTNFGDFWMDQVEIVMYGPDDDANRTMMQATMALVRDLLDYHPIAFGSEFGVIVPANAASPIDHDTDFPFTARMSETYAVMEMRAG